VKERHHSVRNHSGELYDAPQHFRDVSLGRGQFRVFHEGRSDEGGGILYGVADEESRLNLNQASAEELGKLSGMTPDVVAALLDWRDPDNEVTPGGAETDYYVSLQPPGLPRNGPLQTTRELLMVRGLPRDLFLGEDANQNGLLDPEEDDGNDSFPPDNHDGLLDAGWSGLVTVDSAVQNKNAAGEDRINVQTADEKTLASVKGISTTLARAIVAYRNQNQLDTIADLLDVAAVNTSANPLDPLQPAQTSSTTPNSSSGSSAPSSSSSSTRNSGSSSTQSSASSSTRSGANRNSSQTTGPKLISENLLMDIADDLMAGNASEEHPGAININTAGPEVLACLPGVTSELAQAIIAYRRSAGFFPNIAWLLKVDGINRDIFKQMAPRVCGPVGDVPDSERRQDSFHGGAQTHPGHRSTWRRRIHHSVMAGGFVKAFDFMNSAGIYLEIGQSSLKALDGEDGLELSLERQENGRLTPLCAERLTLSLRVFLKKHNWRPRLRVFCALGARGCFLAPPQPPFLVERGSAKAAALANRARISTGAGGIGLGFPTAGGGARLRQRRPRHTRVARGGGQKGRAPGILGDSFRMRLESGVYRGRLGAQFALRPAARFLRSVGHRARSIGVDLV